ncbi:hypothetical protein ANN_11686 [Periplaneta americana]|uniref:Uncharacterized protein n=1 Tax=Periplaneta americana TaxID=6978 RepID=A0ABQ8T7K1_PERAM|nr:hypothetical protein ANN_11686 [Periplaneta americana]
MLMPICELQGTSKNVLSSSQGDDLQTISMLQLEKCSIFVFLENMIRRKRRWKKQKRKRRRSGRWRRKDIENIKNYKVKKQEKEKKIHGNEEWKSEEERSRNGRSEGEEDFRIRTCFQIRAIIRIRIKLVISNSYECRKRIKNPRREDYEDSERFEKIEQFYPIRGHSFLPCDRDFAIVKRTMRKHDRFYSMHQLTKIIITSSLSRKFIVEVEICDIKHFKDWWQEFYKKTCVSEETRGRQPLILCDKEFHCREMDTVEDDE